MTILVDADRASEISQASIEARIVAYADKRAGQRLEPMATRFGHWSRRHPDGWDRATTASAWARARELEEDVCGLATCRPADVRRLAWVGPAIAAARALRAQPPTPAAS